MDPDNQYSPSSSYSILLNNSFSPSASINSSFSTSSNSPWDSVRVIIRVRPLDSELNELDFNNYSGKKQEDESLKITSSSSLEVLNNSNKKFFFNFNHVLDSNISQEQVFELVRDASDSVFEGYNATIFAYGQTGSGKTYTMFGPPSTSSFPLYSVNSYSSWGIIPKILFNLIEKIGQSNLNTPSSPSSASPTATSLTLSCFQIYNENIYDLLNDSTRKNSLNIREEKKEIFIAGLSEYKILSMDDALYILQQAELGRKERETKRNARSSRSHAIFRVNFSKTVVTNEGSEMTYRSKLHLIDLAGSERYPETEAGNQPDDDHILEQGKINLSLLTLGKCISALAKKSKLKKPTTASSMGSPSPSTFSSPGKSRSRPSTEQGENDNTNVHIPFRESKLTHILRHCFNGSSRLILIATVSSSSRYIEETIRTLRFSSRAAAISIKATASIVRPSDYLVIKNLKLQISKLQQEIQHYKESLKNNKNTVGIALNNEEFFASNKNIDLIKKLLTSIWIVNSGSPSVNNQSSDSEINNSIEHLRTTIENNKDSKLKSLLKENYLNAIRESIQLCQRSKNTNIQETIESESPLEVLNELEKNLEVEKEKNNSLRKELEALKFAYLQSNSTSSNIYPNNSQSNTQISSASLFSNIVPSGSNLTAEQINSIEELILNGKNLNEILQSIFKATNTIEDVVKKFFSYKIEEDEMKNKLQEIFNQQHTFFSTSSKTISGFLNSISSIESQHLLENLKNTVNNSPSPSNLSSSYLSFPGLSPLTSTSAPACSVTLSKGLENSPKKNVLQKLKINNSKTLNSSTSSPALSSPFMALSTPIRLGSELLNDIDEEKLKNKILKAKKKNEEKEKLYEWNRLKELKIQEQQKKELEELNKAKEEEILKEQRRQAYAAKQKAKLQAYQERIKNEAEKMQALINLGIDPSSLTR